MKLLDKFEELEKKGNVDKALSKMAEEHDRKRFRR
jgi:hypothetical protein